MLLAHEHVLEGELTLLLIILLACFLLAEWGEVRPHPCAVMYCTSVLGIHSEATSTPLHSLLKNKSATLHLTSSMR